MQICPFCSYILARGQTRGALALGAQHLIWAGQVRLSSSGGQKVEVESEKEANNPLFAANKYVTQPIFEDKDLIFRPTEREVEEAGKLFKNCRKPSGQKHNVLFAKAAYYPEQAPEYNLPEIAMIGRSNVGKSSLIKSLFYNVPGLTVRTSKTPGHTKLLLFYQAGSVFSLVDLPGYGVNQPENFAVTAEGYLRTRKNLQMPFLLIDIHEGFQPIDFTAIEMLEDFSRPYSLIITKVDKISPRKLVTSLMTIRDVIQTKTNTCLPQPFIVSATQMKGISFLQSYIVYLTGQVKLSNR